MAGITTPSTYLQYLVLKCQAMYKLLVQSVSSARLTILYETPGLQPSSACVLHRHAVMQVYSSHTCVW